MENATTYFGTVQDGVVIFDSGIVPPEGLKVEIVPAPPVIPASQQKEAGSIWDKLAQLGREVESIPCDLPEDLAENHNHYLHGHPKRQ